MNADRPHILPDMLIPGLDLVLCGTAASRVAAREGAYYANPGNLFWGTLHQVGLTGRRFAPREFPLLNEIGIGLTDLNKHEFGNDDELSAGGFDIARLAERICGFSPAALAFTSKNAASQFLARPTGLLAYGRQKEDFGETALFVMPSTSGHARRFFRIEPWQELAAFVAARRAWR